MKKLSLVMAAAMCLTVGGVYATWNYADSAKITDQVYEEQVKVQMGEIDESATAASIKLVKNDMAMTIEGEIVNDTINCAVLTPADNTGLDIRVAINKTSVIDTIELTYTLTVTNMEYNGVDIFSFKDAVEDPERPNVFTASFSFDVSINELTEVQADNNNVIYTVKSFTTAELMERFELKLTEAFNLPTKDEFDAFQAQLIGTSLYINVAAKDVSRS